VVGQQHVVRTLRNALTSGRIHHAYLFAGPRGTGKTTSARLLAKAVNCLGPEEQRPCNACAICSAINDGRLLDLIEIDAASNTGVDDVRELRERVGFRPNEARYKVYVVDEVHMLSNAAFNALLKTLEEPPPHAIFVLATTEPHKIPATVLSRCQRFDFRRLSIGDIVARLEWLSEQESIRVDREALLLVARQATGSMRDAESLLDQLASYDDQGITVADIRAALGIGSGEMIVQVVDALASGDVARGLDAINEAVDGGAEPRQFARQLVEYLRTLLLLRLDAGVAAVHVSEDERAQLEAQAASFSPRSLARAVQLFNQAATESKGGWQLQLPLEMAFVEALLPADAQGVTPRGGSAPADSGSSSPGRRSPPASPADPGPGPAPSAASAPLPRAVREVESQVGSSPATGAPLTPAVLQSRWTEILDALRPRNLSLEALLRSCEPAAVEDDVVVLAFAHSFHCAKVEEDHNRRAVEDVLASLTGWQCRVRCVTRGGGAAGVSPPPVQGDASRETALSPETEDPVVRAAVEDLGAQVVQGAG
jgi:DNA polymerase-3 subunit gamma/tau